MATLFSEHRAPTVGLNYIMAELGKEDHSDRWQLRFINLLIGEQGFPAPLPNMRGAALIDAVTTHSRWQRQAVDQWFHDRLPPEAAQAEEAGRQLAANDDMDEAAAMVAARMVGRTRAHGVGVSA
ncbi:hypothetical protein HZY97_16115 [Sphingomonas sp. R-74633]|uniref:hypothetical protein n=1 Tax=Sphingomonas sp. R-74633 TaxID=2751188 RepID=UPI0015D3F3DB|nr:hypothetical protein [Sphingomonas sp. R-74633]NYT42298.1 hypothetical protein [Sphingomonas sp. R-74633]